MVSLLVAYSGRLPCLSARQRYLVMLRPCIQQIPLAGESPWRAPRPHRSASCESRFKPRHSVGTCLLSTLKPRRSVGTCLLSTLKPRRSIGTCLLRTCPRLWGTVVHGVAACSFSRSASTVCGSTAKDWSGRLAKDRVVALGRSIFQTGAWFQQSSSASSRTSLFPQPICSSRSLARIADTKRDTQNSGFDLRTLREILFTFYSPKQYRVPNLPLKMVCLCLRRNKVAPLSHRVDLSEMVPSTTAAASPASPVAQAAVDSPIGLSASEKQEAGQPRSPGNAACTGSPASGDKSTTRTAATEELANGPQRVSCCSPNSVSAAAVAAEDVSSGCGTCEGNACEAVISDCQNSCKVELRGKENELTPGEVSSDRTSEQTIATFIQSATLHESPTSAYLDSDPNVNKRSYGHFDVYTLSSADVIDRRDTRSVSHRPLVILIPWLKAKRRHVEKYCSLYLQWGMDVLHLKVSPMQIIRPMRVKQLLQELIALLKEKNHFLSDRPIVVHGLSIGAFVWGQLLLEMQNDANKTSPAAGALTTIRLTDSVPLREKAVWTESSGGGSATRASLTDPDLRVDKTQSSGRVSATRASLTDPDLRVDKTQSSGRVSATRASLTDPDLRVDKTQSSGRVSATRASLTDPDLRADQVLPAAGAAAGPDIYHGSQTSFGLDNQGLVNDLGSKKAQASASKDFGGEVAVTVGQVTSSVCSPAVGLNTARSSKLMERSLDYSPHADLKNGLNVVDAPQNGTPVHAEQLLLKKLFNDMQLSEGLTEKRAQRSLCEHWREAQTTVDTAVVGCDKQASKDAPVVAIEKDPQQLTPQGWLGQDRHGPKTGFTGAGRKQSALLSSGDGLPPLASNGDVDGKNTAATIANGVWLNSAGDGARTNHEKEAQLLGQEIVKALQRERQAEGNSQAASTLGAGGLHQTQPSPDQQPGNTGHVEQYPWRAFPKRDGTDPKIVTDSAVLSDPQHRYQQEDQQQKQQPGPPTPYRDPRTESELQRRMVCLVMDSPTPMEAILTGIPSSLSNSTAVQAAVRQALASYFRLFPESVASHYVAGEKACENISCLPTLMLYSTRDHVAPMHKLEEVIGKWRQRGLPVQVRRWDDSPHVGHFRYHPEEYTQELYSFLSKYCRLPPGSPGSKTRAKL